MSQAQRTIKVLLISRGTIASIPLSDSFGPGAEITTTESLAGARALLAERRFDCIVASPNVLPSSETWTLPPELDDFEGVPEGVGIVDEHGELIWANPSFLQFAEDVRGFVQTTCAESLASVSSDSGPDRKLTGRRSSYRADDGSLFELTAAPLVEMDRDVAQAVAVVRDVTRFREREKQLDAINAAGRELVRLETEQVSKLSTPERVALLEKKIVGYLHDLMKFDNFSIHLLDKQTNKLEPVLVSGMPQAVQDINLYALPDGNGIAGYVAHHGRAYNCPDVQHDPHYFQGLEGACSSLTVPLRLNDEVIGVLNVESNEPAAFNDEQCRLAEILGRDIATALHILDLLVTERYATTGQLGSDVLAEVTGPMNDILTDVENLVEDYIGHDDLRHRLNKITRDVVAVREAIKRTTSPKRGILGQRSTGEKRNDPILAGKRLLVTDDEPMIRETVRDVLTSYGCEVIVAENGDRAIECLQQQPIDLVLSDIKMPGRNGYEVFAAAKDANPDTPVILMTGFGDDPNHSIVRARREGLAAVLFKPFKVDQLIGEIRAALHTTAE